MKTVRKALILAACAIMLVCATIAGTLAYLTSKDAVTNSFTVGNVSITLDEAPVDADGQETEGARVKTNDYKLLPGKEYDKDPTIHVNTGSEDCYVFVKIENGIANIEAEGNTTITNQMKILGWTEVDSGIYGKATPVSAGDDVVVFENFTISGSVDHDTLAAYTESTIDVTAYAIQADGFKSANDAWVAAGAEAESQA